MKLAIQSEGDEQGKYKPDWIWEFYLGIHLGLGLNLRQESLLLQYNYEDEDEDDDADEDYADDDEADNDDADNDDADDNDADDDSEMEINLGKGGKFASGTAAARRRPPTSGFAQLRVTIIQKSLNAIKCY